LSPERRRHRGHGLVGQELVVPAERAQDIGEVLERREALRRIVSERPVHREGELRRHPRRPILEVRHLVVHDGEDDVRVFLEVPEGRAATEHLVEHGAEPPYVHTFVDVRVSGELLGSEVVGLPRRKR